MYLTFLSIRLLAITSFKSLIHTEWSPTLHSLNTNNSTQEQLMNKLLSILQNEKSARVKYQSHSRF